MSTRCATIVKTKDWNGNMTEVLRFYRHYDGYPEGHGYDLGLALNTLTEEKSTEDIVPRFIRNLVVIESHIEFEPTGCEHGDIEYLYVVSFEKEYIGDDGEVPATIEIYKVGWDERYDDALANEPIFVGSPTECQVKYFGR